MSHNSRLSVTGANQPTLNLAVVCMIDRSMDCDKPSDYWRHLTGVVVPR